MEIGFQLERPTT
uniref:Histonelysine Nmethyltransferase SETMARlike [Bombyx mori] n=1 Tax=Lepeophtheirus salmonis TaxID=72036 RepID=A0A0K2UEN1_LEPSM